MEKICSMRLKFLVFSLLAMIMVLVPAPKNIAKAAPINFDKTEATTTEQTQGNGLDDFTISMGEDGKITTSLDNGGSATSTWGTIFNKGKGFAAGFLGIVEIGLIIAFIYQIGKVAASVNNPSARTSAIHGCWIIAGCFAIAGSLLLFVGLAWNAFK